MHPDLALELILLEVDRIRQLLAPVEMPTTVLAQVVSSLDEIRSLAVETLPGRRLATREQALNAIAEAKALLRVAGDPEPQMTVDFVGAEMARNFAMASIQSRVHVEGDEVGDRDEDQFVWETDHGYDV